MSDKIKAGATRYLDPDGNEVTKDEYEAGQKDGWKIWAAGKKTGKNGGK